jgi:hypothetical protein
MIFNGTRLFSIATDAMEARAIKRLISVTGLGAGDSRGHGGRRSHLGWTIARPTILTTGPRTGAYHVLVDSRDWRSGFISLT